MNKADFIKQVGHENEVINEQIRIIDIMLDTCAQFDGKVINKRYFDFMQKQSGTFTRSYFGFATDDSPREITLECANFGWFQKGEIKFNLRKFHDYPQCTIYPCTLGVGLHRQRRTPQCLRVRETPHYKKAWFAELFKGESQSH